MPGCRTVLSSTVMMASVRWRASPGRTSCRSHALATFYTASSPTGMQWPRWPRRCWAQRNARWRSPTTARMVSAVFPGVAWRSHDTKPLQRAALTCTLAEPKQALFGLFSPSGCLFMPPTWTRSKLQHAVVHLHMLVQTGSFLVLTKCYLEHPVAANQRVHPFGALRGDEQLGRFLCC